MGLSVLGLYSCNKEEDEFGNKHYVKPAQESRYVFFEITDEDGVDIFNKEGYNLRDMVIITNDSNGDLDTLQSGLIIKGKNINSHAFGLYIALHPSSTYYLHFKDDVDTLQISNFSLILNIFDYTAFNAGSIVFDYNREIQDSIVFSSANDQVRSELNDLTLVSLNSRIDNELFDLSSENKLLIELTKKFQ